MHTYIYTNIRTQCVRVYATVYSCIHVHRVRTLPGYAGRCFDHARAPTVLAPAPDVVMRADVRVPAVLTC